MKKLKVYLLKIFCLLPFNNKGYAFKNSIINKGAYLKKCKFIIKGENNVITFEEESRVEKTVFFINGSNNIINIGKNCRFYESKFWIEKDNNSIILNENNKSSGKVIFAAMEGSSINIGKDNLLAYDIEIRTSDGHSILDSNGQRINNARDISIGNHNWLCKKCTILKGTEIKNDNVVGYGAILNKKYDSSNSVFVGTPAMIAKQKINWRYEMI